jgi:hypothetical protein
MSRVLSGQVGTLPLFDLDAIARFFGRDFLPYPFMFTRRTDFANRDEALAYANAVPDRYNHGDLNVFMDSVAAYHEADIRVECHVQYVPPDIPSMRVVAYRSDELGFFASQRPDADVIDVFTVSPYDLSAAICEAVPVTQPGQHPKIVVPEYLPRDGAEFDHGDFSVRHSSASSDEVTIAGSDVAVYATIQSHWRPMRQWGRDPSKPYLVWIRVRDDGEYLYEPDRLSAKPMTPAALRTRIDELIAEDIVLLREFRSD